MSKDKTIDDVLKKYVFVDWIEHIHDDYTYEKENRELRAQAKQEILDIIEGKLPEKLDDSIYETEFAEGYNKSIDQVKEVIRQER